jgi:5-methylcytosine-specific restriction endonuclease McrA
MDPELLKNLTARPASPPPETYWQRKSRIRRERIQANGPQDDYTREEIFERDAWTCQICGGPVDPAIRAPDPGTASIDHVIPGVGAAK